MAVFTIGHGARDIDTLLELLEGAGVRRLVDVRTAPGSRKHPQFGREALTTSLAERGIEYVWRGRELGGWRRARPDSRHTALRSPGFRGYADHMESEEFGEARDWLVATSKDTPTALMCAESLWWKCHRRMLADALVAVGVDVGHIMEGGKITRHKLSRNARVEGDLPVYDMATEEVADTAGQTRASPAGSSPPGVGGGLARHLSEVIECDDIGGTSRHRIW